MTQQFLPVPEIKYNKKSAILGEFQVEIHPTIVTGRMKDAFRNLQQKVSLPGFRPGKVPLDMVVKKYHEDVLHDVFQKLVSENYRKGAVDNKVPVASDPYVTKTNLNDWKEGQALQYTVEVELIPDVEIKKAKGLPLTKREGKIGAEDVNVVIQNLLDPRAELLPLPETTAVQQGHMAVIDFEGRLNGVALPEAGAKNFYIEIGGKDSLKEFQEGIVGMKAGEEKLIHVDYPADFKNKEVAGKKVDYSIKVLEVKEKKRPELTDELAKEFGAETVEDLQSKVKKSLEEEMKEEHARQNEEEILLAFLDANPLEVPPGLVQRQLEHIVQEIASVLKKQQFGDEMVKDYLRNYSKDLHVRAEREVKVALLLPKLIANEKITATEEDIRAHFNEIVKSTDQKLEAIEEFYKKNEHRKTDLARELERKKAVKFLVEHAKGK